MLNMFLYGLALRMKPAGDGDGGGGGDDGKPDAAALAKENADLKARLADLEKKTKEKPDPDQDLNEKARLQREQDAKRNTDSSALEAAVEFNLSGKNFLKEHESILPPEVADIFAQAEAEKNWGSHVAKASAIKDGIIKEFFKIQSNLDLLTATQKNSVENYLRLTKTGREEKAQSVFENILEPTLAAMKREKKAAEVNRQKSGGGTDADRAYREKMVSGSRKHYLRETK